MTLPRRTGFAHRAWRWRRTTAERANGERDWLVQRAWRLLLRQEFAQSAALFKQAADLGDVDAMISLANVLADHLRAPQEAERWYRRAVDLGDGLAAECLGVLRLDQGRTEEAEELFEIAVQRGHTAAYTGLGEIARNRGQLERARGLLEIAIMEGDLYAYALLGDVLSQMGDDMEAESWLRQGLLKRAPGTAAQLAVLLYAVGREDEARALRPIIERQSREAWPPRTP